MDPDSVLRPTMHRLPDHDLELWLERAMGLQHPDPEPILYDVDDLDG